MSNISIKKRQHSNKSSVKKNKVEHAIIYVVSTRNNMIMTAVSKEDRKPIGWSSPGKAGFKGAKKATPFAAQQAAEILVTSLKQYSVKSITIVMSGLGQGREAAIKVLQNGGEIVRIIESTTVAHNGTRQPRRRRV